MNKIDIFVGSPTQYRLDVGDFSMSYNYSFNDIRDITKRNSSYSKTITIPATKNNNVVLGGLFDINSTYDLFNPNIKVPAKVVVNSEVVIEGLLVLNSVDKLNNTDPQGNEMYYNLTIFSQTVDLLEKIGEKTLAECDDLDRYDHIFDETNITDSWTNTYEDGYVYPLLSKFQTTSTLFNQYNPVGAYDYSFDNFFPAVYYKAALDAIINNAGFGWTGSFKDNPQFEKEILPFIGEESNSLSQEDIDERTVNVNRVTQSLPLDIGEGNGITVGNDFVPSPTLIRVPFNNILQDNSSQYDIFNFKIDSQFNIKTRLEVNINFNLACTTQYNQSTGTGADNYAFDLLFQVVVRRNLSNTVVHTYTIGGIKPPTSIFTTQQNTFRLNNNVLFRTGLIDFEQGDEVFVLVKGIYTSGKLYTENIPSGTNQKVFFNITFNPTTSLNTLFRNIFVGATIKLKNFFDNIKQKDLIIDLIKRYNLIITPDPSNPKVLIFDTYKGYFEGNTEVLDWSSKKDYSQQDNIEFIQEIQNNTVLFSYSNAGSSDVYNQKYLDSHNETYGQQEITIANANAGKTEIISPFVPTPIIPTDFGAFVPAINALEPIGKPRVLYYGGLKSMLNNGSFSFLGTSYNQYPYAGHFDDPILPTLDLNFGTCKQYFYDDLIQPPVNNHYNTYWRGYLNQVSDGKLLTAYFYLNELDITKIKNKLSYKVWVKDAYYYINKVIDYNPMNNEPTKVELLKIKDLGVYSDVSYGDVIVVTTSCPSDIVVQNQVINGVTYNYYVSSSGATVTEDCCSELGGVWDSTTQSCFVKVGNLPSGRPTNNDIRPEVETIESGKLNLGIGNVLIGEYEELIIDDKGTEFKVVTKSRQFTFGTDNLTTGNNSFIIGKNNTVLRNDVSVINGSNNTVEGLNITALGVSDKTLDVSNSLYFGNAIRVNTLNGKYYVNDEEVDVAHKVSRRITVAELGELATTPIQLVSEVGTGKYPIIEDVAVYMNTGTTMYNEDQVLEVYIDGAEVAYFQIENILSAGDIGGVYHFDYTVQKKPDKTPYTHTKLDGGIFVRSDVDVTGGDLEIVLTVHYRIVDINNI